MFLFRNIIPKVYAFSSPFSAELSVKSQKSIFWKGGTTSFYVLIYEDLWQWSLECNHWECRKTIVAFNGKLGKLSFALCDQFVQKHKILRSVSNKLRKFSIWILWPSYSSHKDQVSSWSKNELGIKKSILNTDSLIMGYCSDFRAYLDISISLVTSTRIVGS